MVRSAWRIVERPALDLEVGVRRTTRRTPRRNWMVIERSVAAPKKAERGHRAWEICDADPYVALWAVGR